MRLQRLQRLQRYVLCRWQLSDISMWYVSSSLSVACALQVVPQLLTANLRVRGVFLRLLEQIYGSPHIG